MTGLQETFYIMAIIYMAIMFIVMIAGVIAVFAIKAKINSIEQQISEKLHTISNILHFGQEVVGKVKKVAGKA